MVRSVACLQPDHDALNVYFSCLILFDKSDDSLFSIKSDRNGEFSSSFPNTINEKDRCLLLLIIL